MRTTDNNGGKLIAELFYEQDNTDINDLVDIANRSLAVLQKENPDLLIFPHSLGQYHDSIENCSVFDMDEKTITTHNIMGFVGRNTSRITITSRFTKNDRHDYFLHYIYYKTISYMYRFNAKKGMLLFPTKKEKNFYEDYTIKDTDGILKKIGLAIPQSAHTFADFVKTMHQNEQDLLKNIRETSRGI